MPYYFWAIAFIIIPLLLVLYYGLTSEAGTISLENVFAIARPAHAKALFLSVLLSVGCTVVCLLLAYPLCLIMVNRQKAQNSFLLFMLIIPMWMNFMLRTYAWQSLLEKHGVLNTFLNTIGLPSLHLINTPGAIIFGMVYDFLPFMILPIYNALQKIDPNLIHAAHDLGAGFWQTLWKVILPLSMPGIISGITMVFVPGLTTFVISALLGGGKVLLIGNVIEQEFTQAYDWHLGSGLSLVLLLFIVINMILSSVFDREGNGGLL
ncbi:MAG: ABC transporter permease [Lachnospiraceae bacterium]|nr:ABC transporter permease [Candidatus Equihabitans merdae]